MIGTAVAVYRELCAGLKIVGVSINAAVITG